VVGSGACGADGKRAGPRSRRMSGKCSNWCGPGMCYPPCASPSLRLSSATAFFRCDSETIF
jgi:hypothetical protein